MSARNAFGVLTAAIDVVVSLTPVKQRIRIRQLAEEFRFSVAVALELVEPWARIKDPDGRPREVPVDPTTRLPR